MTMLTISAGSSLNWLVHTYQIVFGSAIVASPQPTSGHNCNVIRSRKTLLYPKNGNFYDAKPAWSVGPNSISEQTNLMLAFARMGTTINSCFLSLALLYLAFMA